MQVVGNIQRSLQDCISAICAKKANPFMQAKKPYMFVLFHCVCDTKHHMRASCGEAAFDAWTVCAAGHEADVLGDNTNNEYLRFGRENNGYIRFGKNDPFLRFGIKNDPFLRFGKQDPFLRIGRQDPFLRFGRQDPFLRIGKQDPFLRIGKQDPFLRIGKQDPFLRFGRNDPYLRFGRNDPYLRFGRNDPYLRFGRNDPYLRFGKNDPFLRFGKSVDSQVETGVDAVTLSREHDFAQENTASDRRKRSVYTDESDTDNRQTSLVREAREASYPTGQVNENKLADDPLVRDVRNGHYMRFGKKSAADFADNYDREFPESFLGNYGTDISVPVYGKRGDHGSERKPEYMRFG